LAAEELRRSAELARAAAEELRGAADTTRHIYAQAQASLRLILAEIDRRRNDPKEKPGGPN
jgi:hypothetical protein